MMRLASRTTNIVLGSALTLGLLLGSARAFSQPQHGPVPSGAPATAPALPEIPRPGARPGLMQDGRPGMPPGHMMPPGHRMPPSHGNAEHGAGAEHATGSEHGGEHAGPEPMNWVYGLISEKEGLAESNLLFRRPGTPPPFLASLLNFGILVAAIVVFGRKPLAEGLQKRRDTIMREIDEAGRVRAAAKKRLDSYKKKLDDVALDAQRISEEYATQSERDRARIVREAEETRARMRRDAEFLLQQERKEAHERALATVAAEASARAEEMLRRALSNEDRERLQNEYLGDISRGVRGAA